MVLPDETQDQDVGEEVTVVPVTADEAAAQTAVEEVAVESALPDDDTSEPEPADAEAEEGDDSGGEDEEEDESLPLDLMDIFESEELVEPTVAIPGLENLRMSEVAAEAESVLEELKSRFLA
jgi:hypothetical protein